MYSYVGVIPAYVLIRVFDKIMSILFCPIPSQFNDLSLAKSCQAPALWSCPAGQTRKWHYF